MGDDMDAVRSKGLEVEHSLDTLDTTLLVYIYSGAASPHTSHTSIAAATLTIYYSHG